MTALRLAHRGDWRRAPENSVPALLAAVAVVGCDGLEFDVRVAADGVPVLLHDPTLARVQKRPEHVADLASAQLAKLGVPTLDEALDAVGPGPFLDVELKGIDHGLATAEVLRRHRGTAGTAAVVSSFQPRALRDIASRLPRWARWLNALNLDPSTLEVARGLGCSGVAVQWRGIDARGVRRARDAGLEVAAWTVRRRSTFERLDRLGAVAICVEGAALGG